MQVQSLGFRTDLMLRRLAGAIVDDRGDHLVVRTPANPGFYWGNFLLLEKPPAAGEAGRWLDVFAKELPDAKHVAIGVDGIAGDTGDVAELVAEGFELEDLVVLTAEQLTGKPGADVEIRRLSGDSDWQQATDVRMTLEEKTEPEHLQFVERKLAESRQLVEAGHGAYFGAVVDGVVRATLGIFCDEQRIARYQNVETHADFRRRGLASALLHAAARAATDEFGATTLVIVAESDYHAIDLYRRLGFADTERQVQLQRAP